MINFKKVRWKNLLSSGNTFTEITLDAHQTTLILGENGAGKSTLLDALCFGLYGRGFRNLKKDLLINSINMKELLVEVEFNIGRREYKVIRGAKPNKFELYVDDKFVNQDATVRDYQEHLEKNVLKMSFRSFTQVAILGSANFTPFMQLKSTERRKLVEDLLDISIFSTMRDLLRKKVSAHNIETKETSHKIELTEERISGLQEQVSALRETREAKIDKYERTVNETQTNIEDLISQVEGLNLGIESRKSTISDRDPQGSRLKQATDLQKQLENSAKKVIAEIKFYETNDDCPTCKQDLDEEHKKSHIATKQKKKDELDVAVIDIGRTIQDSSNRLEEIAQVQREIDIVQRDIGLLQTEVISNQKFIQKIQKEVDELKEEVAAPTNVGQRMEDSEEQLSILHSNKKNLVEQTHYFDIASTLLRDQGVKEKIIRQYVPIMNKLINKYLAQLEFYVGFELNESFDETIKSRFRDVFKYDNFSQGEKMRIDLALLFTWRSVARMKNSVNTNLLILDEVFDSSLDVGGTDEFLKLLNTLTEKTNAFIISHKGDALYDKFNEVIRFEKHKNFSRVAE
jgi:DNA repair exonuclease SbcCD ATPase subunit